MQVREVMTRQVETVRPNSTIQEAAQKMRDFDIGPLPVCEHGRIVGLVTDRDIAIRSTAEGQDPFTEHVSEIMSRTVVTIHENADVAEAAQLMREHQVRRLVVLDADGSLVGIVALADVATGGDAYAAEEALEGVSRPAAQAHK